MTPREPGALTDTASRMNRLAIRAKPAMVLIGTLSFVAAAGVTSSIILLASRDTRTLSVLALQYGSGTSARLEEAGIISLIIMALTLSLALPIRLLAGRMGVRHDVRVEG